MGALCSAKQKKIKGKITIEKEINRDQNDFQVLKLETRERQATLKNRTFAIPPTQQNQIEAIIEPEALRTKKLLDAQRKLQGLLDLIGSLDQLPAETREYLNQLIILRSNISIMTQNSVKKGLRNNKILKKPDQNDEELIYNDKQFSQNIAIQMMKVVESLDKLEIEPGFESSFPILSFSFLELKQQIMIIFKDYEDHLKKNDENHQEGIKSIKKESAETKNQTAGHSNQFINL